MLQALDVDRQTLDTREALIELIDNALQRGVSASRLSYVTGDSMFVVKLRRGHRYRLSTLLQAKTHITAFLNASIPPFLRDFE